MVEKTRIAAVLQESGLLLPDLIDRALAANDRIKFLFTWLQTAARQAERPGAATLPGLGEDAARYGLEKLHLQQAMASVGRDNGGYRIPGAKPILEQITADLSAMLDPFRALDGGGEPRYPLSAFQSRFDRLSRLPDISGDCIPGTLISGMTRAQRDAGDSLHLLVMDLHKAINSLQAELAEESIDGARAYRILESDRPLIAAFMCGLNRTAPLKFDHPGLGTTATRSGERLVIQNDIGTTDAHVLVIHVDKLTVTVTYTDIHNRRLRFFQDRLKKAGVAWSDMLSRRAVGLEDEEFYLSTGTAEAKNANALQACLEAIGASIVYLIDWNKARKRLRMFVAKSRTIELLRWAADHEIGHRGFLKLGGERLIYEALDGAGQSGGGVGRPLNQILGEDETLQFLRFVMKTCTEGLLQKRSTEFIAEEIRGDLAARLQTASDQVMTLVMDHAALIRDIADLVGGALMRTQTGDPDTARQARRSRAKHWESEADRLVNQVRVLVERNGANAVWRKVIEAADDVADGLEEAMFQISLLPTQTKLAAREPMIRLARLLVGGAQDYVRALSLATHVHRGSTREDVRGLLTAVDRLRDMEHATDKVLREVIEALVNRQPDARALMLEHDIAQNLEGAGDSLLHAGFTMSDYVLEARLRS